MDIFAQEEGYAIDGDSIMDTTPAAIFPAKSGVNFEFCERNNIRTVEKESSKDDEISCFTKMISLMIRSLPKYKRRLVQLRLMEVICEVE
ncbi:uncharacterized protein LOC117119517 isoform X2 [Anneissia japonica]|uniref:uncharacterized protein LOC117119517 isoform X2 n=1 Tax=Anneissia japonica TaxID=1529436 RepID=UPI0014255062|nr:uncharacterized protein LOC117119517 isoform X2 [Anneissia japonica]